MFLITVAKLSLIDLSKACLKFLVTPVLTAHETFGSTPLITEELIFDTT